LALTYTYKHSNTHILKHTHSQTHTQGMSQQPGLPFAFKNAKFAELVLLTIFFAHLALIWPLLDLIVFFGITLTRCQFHQNFTRIFQNKILAQSFFVLKF
jgi:hypothetical protein